MRGKGRFCMMQLTQCGITPAYAGKSVSYEKLPSVNKDHPRLCGEKDQGKEIRIPHLGSPPPMRGKVTLPSGNFTDTRITPAYAGKSMVSGVCSPELRDHPRLCGEKPPNISQTMLHDGSPPPMRGKGVSFTYAETFPGITPAYAGKSNFDKS